MISFLNHIKDIIVKELDQITQFLGHHSYIGFGGATVPLIGSVAYQTVVNPTHYHPLQIISWIIAGLVGIGTILALIKTHTTAFDKIKWIKKK